MNLLCLLPPAKEVSRLCNTFGLLTRSYKGKVLKSRKLFFSPMVRSNSHNKETHKFKPVVVKDVSVLLSFCNA